MKKLSVYLRINSVFSLLTGVLMVLYSIELLKFFNISNHQYLCHLIGLNLIIFACFVWYVSAKQLERKVLVKIISFLDILWALGSLIIVAFQFFNLSLKGYFLIAIVAIWIGFLAFKQLKHNNFRLY